MRCRVKTSTRIEGRLYRLGDQITLDVIPSILAGDLEPIPDPPAPKPAAPATAPHPVAVTLIPPRKFANKPTLWRLNLFVTGRCNMDCAHCSQAQFRHDHGDMDFTVAETAIAKVRDSGRKMIFSATGGEPTLWPHLHRLFVLVKESGCFPETWLFSNGTKCELIRPLLAEGLLDCYRTNAANCRPECRELAKDYPDRVLISESGHYPLLRRPVWNSLPAQCNCPGLAVQGDRVWPCANWYSIIVRHGLDLGLYRDEYARPVGSDWIEFFAERESEKYTSRMCTLCEANKLCQKVMPVETKVLRYRRGV
jgi:hypothetical protein